MTNTTPNDIRKTLLEMDNDDENMLLLGRAMHHYCSNYDKCTGYKQAILETLIDQYENHEDEQEEDSLDELADILNGNTKYCDYEDIDMLVRENKSMANALLKLGYTNAQISDICNGAI